jgi:uncharacterized protein YdhG (YjbR/CyaY superfamily)
MKVYKTIDQYIGTFPKDVQIILESMRETIRKAAPKAKEAISYGIPTFKLNGNLVHFGGFKKHVSFFPASSGVLKFQKEITKYKTSKGTIRFLLNEKIPLTLISKIVKFRVKENLSKL